MFLERKRLLDDDELAEGAGSDVEFSASNSASHSVDLSVNRNKESDVIFWTFDEAVEKVGFGRYQFFLFSE